MITAKPSTPITITDVDKLCVLNRLHIFCHFIYACLTLTSNSLLKADINGKQDQLRQITLIIKLITIKVTTSPHHNHNHIEGERDAFKLKLTIS